MTAAPTMLACAQEYLAFRRALGFTLGSLGQEVLLFARWADRTGHTGPLTTELMVRWAQQTPRGSPGVLGVALPRGAPLRAAPSPERSPDGGAASRFARSDISPRITPTSMRRPKSRRSSRPLGACVPVCARIPMRRCSVC